MAELEISRSNTILYSGNWNTALQFYRDTLGLDISFQNEWFVEFQLGNCSHLSVANASHATIPAGHGDGITLSWKVPDIEVAASDLARLGIDVTAIGERWGSSYVEFHDPDGVRIELWSSNSPVE